MQGGEVGGQGPGGEKDRQGEENEAEKVSAVVGA